MSRIAELVKLGRRMSHARQLLLWPNGDLDAAPERWLRTGECVRCGACCEDHDRPDYFIGLLVDGDDGADGDDADREVSSSPEGMGGTLPSGAVVAEDWDGWWVFWRQSGVRPGPCPQWKGDGVCAVYGADDFPHVCRKWPVLPMELENYPACGYRFVRCL
jgi:hypothetical protein